MPTKVLRGFRDSPKDYDVIEAVIRRVFLREIYMPIIEELGITAKTLKNSMQDLLDAIRAGLIWYQDGRFTGSFSSLTSKELKSLGGTWDRKQGSWRVPESKLPVDVSLALATSADNFKEVVKRVQKRLDGIDPKKLAQTANLTDFFEVTLSKTNKEFQDSVKHVTVAPDLTDMQRGRIAKEYGENMQIYIQDFAEEEIKELRQKVGQRALQGVRYESLVKDIQESYGTSLNKAKFLARQETRLMISKFHQVRCEDAGITKYRWQCVAGSPAHPVRPMHKALDGTMHTWDNPPVVDEQGHKKHPGQDYNCRCTARPIVEF